MSTATFEYNILVDIYGYKRGKHEYCNFCLAPRNAHLFTRTLIRMTEYSVNQYSSRCLGLLHGLRDRVFI